MRYNRTVHSILVANEDDYGARPRCKRGWERNAFVTLFTLSLYLFLLFTLGACTDKFGNIDYVDLSFTVETDKLELPEGVTISLTDAVLTMEDFNRWTEILTYSIVDIEQDITIKRGYYNRMVFTAVLHYRHEGEDVSYPVTCYVNNISQTPQNMIHPQIEATLPLERSNR